MLRTPKAKNAKSKRAIERRDPKLVEDAKTALFAKGSTTSGVVNTTLHDLLQLKKPDGLMFARKNDVHPFDENAIFESWSHKNDAGFVVFGRHSKKRPHQLVIARMFNHRILDMLEVGIEHAVPMAAFRGGTAAFGVRPVFVFAGDLFDSQPLYIQLKSLLLDLLHGRVADNLNLKGLEYVISVTCGPLGADAMSNVLTTEMPALLPDPPASPSSMPLVHLRVYSVNLLQSGHREPRVSLKEMGPALDIRPRRCQSAEDDTWKRATTLKPAQSTKQRGAAKRQNVGINEMGDTVGRIHVGVQDLSKLQSRKLKGLKRDRKQ